MLQEKRFVFTAPRQAELETFELPPPGAGQVRVRLTHSMLSPGTEGICYHREVEPGSHWDQWIKYPFYPGYTAIGIVEELGSGVVNLKIGDRVAAQAEHYSAANVDEIRCFPIPAALPAEIALWFRMAKISASAVKRAGSFALSRVAVIGAGPIGQFAARWARAYGATEVAVIDRIARRLEMAEKGGVKILSLPLAECREQLSELLGGQAPDLVIDSTGAAPVFAQALKLTADHGRLILLGDTPHPEAQHLTGDLICRGLTVLGAHDMHIRPENPAPWNTGTVVQTFFALCVDGRIKADGLVTHRFRPEDVKEIYRLNDEHRDQIMGVVIDWQ